MNAYEAILEALIARGRTGEGADIRVSMFDSMMEWMAVPMLYTRGRQCRPSASASAHPSIAPYGVFQTRDGDGILISIQNDREWAVFARDVLRRADMIEDARFATNSVRVANREETDGIVAACFAGHGTGEMIALLDKADIAYGRVSDIATLLKHPHLRRMAVGSPRGEVLLPQPAAQVQGAARSFGPVPAIGSHDDSVRREFLPAAPPTG